MVTHLGENARQIDESGPWRDRHRVNLIPRQHDFQQRKRIWRTFNGAGFKVSLPQSATEGHPSPEVSRDSSISQCNPGEAGLLKARERSICPP